MLAAAFVFAVGATPLAGRLARRMRLLDEPGRHKGHAGPIPLLGGVALWFAVLGSLLLLGSRQVLLEAAGIMIGATAVSFLGLWDDRYGLPVSVRLVGQALAVAVVLIGGLQVRLPVAPAVNILITLLWMLGVTNSLNLLDNMDGLSAGVGAVAAGGLLILAVLNEQYLVAILAAAILGACLGFLLYNFNPARIFMGDSGSLFLGFLLAAAGVKLRFPDSVPQITWMVPVLVLLVPIFDMLLVVVSRLRRGRNPLTSPGRDHLSHRLVRLGLSHRGAVVVLCLLGGLLAGLAILVSVSGIGTAYGVAATVAVVAVAALIWLESPARQPAP